MSTDRAIALIAHDRCKPDMVAFARAHADALRRETLIATRTTGSLLEREVGLDVGAELGRAEESSLGEAVGTTDAPAGITAGSRWLKVSFPATPRMAGTAAAIRFSAASADATSSTT